MWKPLSDSVEQMADDVVHQPVTRDVVGDLTDPGHPEKQACPAPESVPGWPEEGLSGGGHLLGDAGAEVGADIAPVT